MLRVSYLVLKVHPALDYKTHKVCLPDLHGRKILALVELSCTIITLAKLLVTMVVVCSIRCEHFTSITPSQRAFKETQQTARSVASILLVPFCTV